MHDRNLWGSISLRACRRVVCLNEWYGWCVWKGMRMQLDNQVVIFERNSSKGQWTRQDTSKSISLLRSWEEEGRKEGSDECEWNGGIEGVGSDEQRKWLPSWRTKRRALSSSFEHSSSEGSWRPNQTKKWGTEEEEGKVAWTSSDTLATACSKQYFSSFRVLTFSQWYVSHSVAQLHNCGLIGMPGDLFEKFD